MKRNKLKLVGGGEFATFAKENEGSADIDKLVVRQSCLIQEVKEVKVAGEENTLEFIITNSKLDRDQDTIALDGWDYSNYLKNPVVLWAHDYGLPPVGRSIATYQEGDNMISRTAFTPKDLNEFGYMIYRMYQQKFMNAVSVGFIPSEYTFAEERNHGINFIKQEMLEFSAVPVPSNPHALIQARSAGIEMAPMVEWAEKILDGEGTLIIPKSELESMRTSITDKTIISLPHTKSDTTQVLKETFKSLLDTVEAEPLQLILVDMDKEAGDVEEGQDRFSKFYNLDDEKASKFIKGVLDNFNNGDYTLVETSISYRRAHRDGTVKADLTEKWDSATELAKVEITDIKSLCAWIDVENTQEKSAYKFLHHKSDEDNTVVMRGVAEAMGVLLGIGGGISLPEDECKEVYDHLKKHYEEFEQEVPDFKYVKAQVMKHLADVYEFNNDSGELKLINSTKDQGDGQDLENEFDFELEEKSSDLSGADKNVFEVDGIDSVEEMAELLKSASKAELNTALGRLD